MPAIGQIKFGHHLHLLSYRAVAQPAAFLTTPTERGAFLPVIGALSSTTTRSEAEPACVEVGQFPFAAKVGIWLWVDSQREQTQHVKPAVNDDDSGALVSPGHLRQLRDPWVKPALEMKNSARNPGAVSNVSLLPCTILIASVLTGCQNFDLDRVCDASGCISLSSFSANIKSQTET